MRKRNIYCYFEGKLWGIFLPPISGGVSIKNSCTDNDTAERMIITPYGNNVELNVRRKSKSWRTLQTLHS